MYAYLLQIHGCVDGYSRKIMWLEVSPLFCLDRCVVRVKGRRQAYLYSLMACEPRHSQVTLNKRAETMLPFFLLACAEFGWPSRVRFDRGTEAVDIARRQTAHWLRRGYPADRGSVLLGPSVHNTRIEALWNFLGKTAAGFFRRLFNEMERLGILDPFDPRHLFALHRAFLGRIKSAPPAHSSFCPLHQCRFRFL